MGIGLIEDGVAAGCEKCSGVPDRNHDADESLLATFSQAALATAGPCVPDAVSSFDAVLFGVTLGLLVALAGSARAGRSGLW